MGVVMSLYTSSTTRDCLRSTVARDALQTSRGVIEPPSPRRWHRHHENATVGLAACLPLEQSEAEVRDLARRRVARGVALRDFRQRRNAALDAEVENLLQASAEKKGKPTRRTQTQAPEDPLCAIRWREIAAHRPPLKTEALQESAVENIVEARLRVGLVQDQMLAQHETQREVAVEHSSTYLAPQSVPRGCMAGGIAPEKVIARQGGHTPSAEELHWRRVAMEETRFLRGQLQAQHQAELEAVHDLTQAQLDTAQLSIISSEAQRMRAEDAMVAMRDSWLVKPPPQHYERRLTQELVDHGEKWWESTYGKML